MPGISVEDMLDWLITKGVNPVIRSTNKGRLIKMLSLKGSLTERALERCKDYDRQYRLCPDPNTMGKW